ncbi:MAG: hypothetical protein SWI22_12885, partial [Pseudomonadota bacterium]|nr:hypothetical protein [Pseudomonadota bacterium]
MKRSLMVAAAIAAFLVPAATPLGVHAQELSAVAQDQEAPRARDRGEIRERARARREADGPARPAQPRAERPARPDRTERPDRPDRPIRPAPAEPERLIL